MNTTHKTINIEEIIQFIKNGNFSLPTFQRPFHYNVSRITSFADSLLRGIYISELMFFEPSKEVSFNKIRPLEIIGAEIDEENNIYIGDGQHRITMLSYIFNIFNSNKSLYFADLLVLINNEFPEDNIEDISGLYDTFNLKDFEISNKLCVSFRVSKNIENSKLGGRFLNLSSLLNDNYLFIIDEFLNNLNVSLKNKKKYKSYLEEKLSNILLSKINTVTVSELSAGQIQDIFEVKNNTSKKLNTMELLNAITSGPDSSMFTYFDAEIKNLEIELMNEKCILLNKSVIDTQFIYESLLFSEQYSQNKSLTAAQKYLTVKSISDWQKMWRKNKQNFKKIMDIFCEFDILSKTSNKFLKVLVAVFLNEESLIDNSNFKQFIMAFYIKLTLSNTSKDQTEINKIVDFLRNKANSFVTMRESKLKYNFNEISKETILTQVKLKTELFFLTKQLLHTQSTDYFAVDITGKRFRDINRLEEHHIIPKGSVSKQEFKENIVHYNSIANIALIRKDDNQKIGSTPFHVYSKDLVFEDLRDNLIPSYSSDLEFIEARADLISKEVNSILDRMMSIKLS